MIGIKSFFHHLLFPACDAGVSLQVAIAEIAEFNRGYDDCLAGILYENEPHDTPYDQWRVGWAWADFNHRRNVEKESA